MIIIVVVTAILVFVCLYFRKETTEEPTQENPPMDDYMDSDDETEPSWMKNFEFKPRKSIPRNYYDPPENEIDKEYK